MDIREFENTIPVILKELDSDNYNEKLSKTYDAFRDFMYDNPDEYIVKNAKKTILEKYKKLFQDPALISALNPISNLEYFNRQQVYRYLPFIHTRRNYFNLLFKLFIIPSEYYGHIIKSYDACKYLFNEFKDITTPPDDDIFDKINEYINNNQVIMKASLEFYEDLDTEYKKYKMSDFELRQDEDYKTYLFLNRLYDTEEAMYSYRNKKLGTCGEYYIWNSIKNRINASFVSKNLGNGFGYDIYYQDTKDGKVIEKLIEVKTTAQDGDDYFTLSENEYNVLLNSLNKENVEYLLCRVYYDENKYKIFHEALRYEKNLNMFISIYNGEPKYILNGHRRFEAIANTRKRVR